MQIAVFELGEVAAILNLPTTRVKNWTIGRPFSVRPSIRASFGKGSRNLFSKNDVCCLALLERLIGAGASVADIQKMLEAVKPHLAGDDFWKNPNWLLVNRTGRASFHAALAYAVSFTTESSANFKLQPEDEIGCFYGVNLQSLGEAVSIKIESFMQRQKTSCGLLARKASEGKAPRKRTR
jgi:hypothetical protein